MIRPPPIDWQALALSHLAATGADPELAFMSMRSEVEKVAVVGALARGAGAVVRGFGQAGTGAANLAGRAMGRLSQFGRGLQLQYAAGKGGFELPQPVLQQLAKSREATQLFRGMAAPQQAALAQKWAPLGAEAATLSGGTAQQAARGSLERFVTRAPGAQAAVQRRTAQQAAAAAGTPAAGAAQSGAEASAAAQQAAAKGVPEAGAQAAEAAAAQQAAQVPLMEQAAQYWQGLQPWQRNVALVGAGAVPAFALGGGFSSNRPQAVVQR